MERDVEAKDAKIKELNEEIDKLNGASSLNPQLMAVETENNELRRKILNLEKEIGMAQAKIKEAEFLMETRRKERATESQLKRQLQNNIEMKRLQIDEAHRMNELIIEQKVKEKQDSELRQKETEHNKILDRIQNVKRRTGMEEQEIEKICQEKVTIQQDIIEQEQIKEKLEKDLVTAKKKAHELKIQLEFLEDKYKQQTARIEPLKNMEEKQKTIIPSYESEIKNYEDQIAQFDKQVILPLTSDRIRKTSQGTQFQ
jgi:chromosome segregation ATPase